MTSAGLFWWGRCTWVQCSVWTGTGFYVWWAQP